MLMDMIKSKRKIEKDGPGWKGAEIEMGDQLYSKELNRLATRRAR
jgi:hypothetical protein